MKRKYENSIVLFVFGLLSISLACATVQPAPTNTPQPTATYTVVPTDTSTPRPSPTLRPTLTPNVAATQFVEERAAEVQQYFDLGYLSTTNGTFIEYGDFNEEWAQLGWYSWWIFDETARDFYLSAHFKWSSAYRNANTSGCGFAFAIQDNADHYAVFLDRSRIYFVEAGYYYHPIGPTRGTGTVHFGNPFDQPQEADFTVIVNDAYTRVLVNSEVAGEYTLSQSKPLNGRLGLALLSGTNKEFGTRCEMTNLHAWIPAGE